MHSRRPSDLDALLQPSSAGRVLVLTGAGISAESGIPTFRGAEGYWRVGSREYRPMELATRVAFGELPDEVWGWYLYRRSVCRAAKPNAAHQAIARLERVLGDRFTLVTQNVDGLHLRAGNSGGRTLQIHGNIDFMRCAAGCRTTLTPLPPSLGEHWERGKLPGDKEKALLRCPACGALARPHVLWFDEYYDEPLFHVETSLHAAAQADVLVVIGTSGATNLPVQIYSLAQRREIPMIVVDPEPTVFSELASQSRTGTHLQETASDAVPVLVKRIEAFVSS